jgi:hypothetical protein
MGSVMVFQSLCRCFAPQAKMRKSWLFNCNPDHIGLTVGTT